MSQGRRVIFFHNETGDGEPTRELGYFEFWGSRTQHVLDAKENPVVINDTVAIVRRKKDGKVFEIMPENIQFVISKQEKNEG